jgi:nucleoside phosphorylase
MIFTTAGVGAALMFAVATLLGLPSERRDAWLTHGLAGGFVIGLTFYVVASVAQALYGQ